MWYNISTREVRSGFVDASKALSMPEHSFDFSTDRQLLRRLSVFYAIIKALLFIRVCARSYYIMSIMQSGKLHDKAPEKGLFFIYLYLIGILHPHRIDWKYLLHHLR